MATRGEETLVIAAERNSTDADELRKAIADRVNATFGHAAGHVAIVGVGSFPNNSRGKLQRRRAKLLFEQDLLEEHES